MTDVAQPVVLLERACKTYAAGDLAVPALRDADFRVEPGEFVAIMGPSGSGKSTLLNLLGCLTGLTSGRYLLDGRDISRAGRNELAAIRNRRIGFVFQQFNLLARLDAVENVATPLIYAGTSARERTERARAGLEALGLGHRLGHFPNQLSGGEQQRVAVARALVNRPALLLADEPTGNLDSRTGSELMALFASLTRQGTTLVMVTHDESMARQAHRTVRVRDGRIESGANAS